MLDATVRNSPAPLDSGVGSEIADPPQVMGGGCSLLLSPSLSSPSLSVCYGAPFRSFLRVVPLRTAPLGPRR